MSHARVLAVLVLAASAGAAAAAGAGDPPPTGTRGLVRWLRAGEWRAAYVAEPGPRPSATAHGRSVRTWYSPVLVEDLAAGRTTFRKGAAMVKELFDPTGTTLQGFAVMRKVRARGGAGGRGWFFWETASPPFRGRGLPVCVGCHADGIDFLLSGFRP